MSQWFKQLLVGQEQQGTAKAAAAAWLGTIYALRAASRLDGNKEWGRTGDDMIGCLEQAYVEHMGSEGAQALELGRRLLRTDEAPSVPKPVVVPRAATRVVRPTMPKLPHMRDIPHIKSGRERADLRASARAKSSLSLKAKAKTMAKSKPVVAKAKPVVVKAKAVVAKAKPLASKVKSKTAARAKGRR